jgi:hypothetical protein
MMASSVDRRIEGDLSEDMGQRDPASLITPRSTEPIRACGLPPRQQAGHMTASDHRFHARGKSLPAGGHPHMPSGRRIRTRGDPRELAEVRRDIAGWLAKWQTKHRCPTGSKRTPRRRSPITGYRYSIAST